MITNNKMQTHERGTECNTFCYTLSCLLIKYAVKGMVIELIKYSDEKIYQIERMSDNEGCCVSKINKHQKQIVYFHNDNIKAQKRLLHQNTIFNSWNEFSIQTKAW